MLGLLHLFLVSLTILVRRSVGTTEHQIILPLDFKSYIESQKLPLILNRDSPTKDELENATFVVLCRNEDLYDLLETIQSIQDRFNSKYSYDWVFLNDVPFTSHFIYSVANFITNSTLKFGQIDPHEWDIPSWINQTYMHQLWDENYQDTPYGTSESYRLMCRYFSGFLHNHPLIQPYQYYWRIEPGVKYYCDIDYDVFRHMRENDLLYGFTISMFEYRDTIPSLWSHFKQFMQNTNREYGDLIRFVMNDDDENSYNLCHFWSNSEIANLDIFRGRVYKEYFEYLDQTGGFFYERWGDAPVHSLFVSSFLEPEDVWWFGDMGYYHGPYLQCPQDSKIFELGKCSCNPTKDFSFGYYSCTEHFLKIRNHFK
ncbi:alpha-1,2 mannosyltransferase Ktr1p [[Candida] anglica]|uniref:Alpha-1,2 mannosyltransferase Ktr1p n=1 Tax=[Candida] anglica TaxID=148631 RepID=A0ABP0EKQ9_9ASCO